MDAKEIGEIMVKNLATYNSNPEKYDNEEFERSKDVQPFEPKGEKESLPSTEANPPKVKPSRLRRRKPQG